MWSSSNIIELDEAYTSRVLGFGSIEDMYRWVSCVGLLNEIDDLPMLLVNASDDPCIVEESYVFPREYAGMFVRIARVCTLSGLSIIITYIRKLIGEKNSKLQGSYRWSRFKVHVYSLSWDNRQ